MSWPGVIVCAYVAAVSIPLVVVDVREHRLPNKLVVPGVALAGLCGVLELVLTGGHNFAPLLCGALYFALMLVLSLIGGLGMGDVKLAALLGVAGGFISAEAVLAQVILSFIAGGLVAGVLWMIKRRGRIPFGPFMLLGYWVVVALGPRLMP
jgi:leader peptidase (prepilin peptidase)/N-methyltransferase